ncbi:hypothetical protein ZHAS_00011729 [Anopheles sinensis]|uniref:Uncharacterized protein n=1 Tax=Anopheles sinensis TaxID=74873 RepID=A0A084W112_ANOSI|nr:hypothetical protein ZHAS_00011729 [Anopheles sinensis]
MTPVRRSGRRIRKSLNYPMRVFVWGCCRCATELPSTGRKRQTPDARCRMSVIQKGPERKKCQDSCGHPKAGCSLEQRPPRALPVVVVVVVVVAFACGERCPTAVGWGTSLEEKNGRSPVAIPNIAGGYRDHACVCCPC